MIDIKPCPAMWLDWLVLFRFYCNDTPASFLVKIRKTSIPCCYVPKAFPCFIFSLRYCFSLFALAISLRWPWFDAIYTCNALSLIRGDKFNQLELHGCNWSFLSQAVRTGPEAVWLILKFSETTLTNKLFNLNDDSCLLKSNFPFVFSTFRLSSFA